MSSNPNNLVPMPARVWGVPLLPRREALWLAENKRCHWCGCPTRLCDECDPDQATIEHIKPRCKGGTNDPSNLTSACRQCNCRRSYEDARNMREGALLGKWPLKNGCGKPKMQKHVALTGDEKRAIIGKKSTEDVLREQRDQALKEIGNLRKEMKQWEATVKAKEENIKALKAMTLMKFLRKRLAEWILS